MGPFSSEYAVASLTPVAYTSEGSLTSTGLLERVGMALAVFGTQA